MTKCPACNHDYNEEKLGRHLEIHDVTPKDEAANYLVYLKLRKVHLRQLCHYLKRKS